MHSVSEPPTASLTTAPFGATLSSPSDAKSTLSVSVYFAYLMPGNFLSNAIRGLLCR